MCTVMPLAKTRTGRCSKVPREFDGDRVDRAIYRIYKQIFKEAEPSVDFDEILKRSKIRTLPANWFLKYYLDEDRQQKIIEMHCRRSKLTPAETGNVKFNVMLGVSPAGSKNEK